MHYPGICMSSELNLKAVVCEARFFLMRFITSCAIMIIVGSAIGVHAYSTSDFLTPPDWFAHGLGNSGGVGNNGSIEPINVIISAQSNVDPFGILTGSLSWDSCFNSLSTLQANVQPGQQDPINQVVGLRDGGCLQFFVGGNHLRAWPQTLTDGSTAYFIAASEEHGCRSDGGNAIPWPLWNWHCIDDDGFNQGRDDLVAEFIAGASASLPVYTIQIESAQLYSSGTGTDAGSGSSVDHIPYDGSVSILTLL
jgi:hypothetical protein